MNDEMVDEFKIEAAEMFEQAEEGFLAIEKGENFFENFNLIFRSFHSLKGAAGMFGLMELQSHMHKLESLFEAQKPKGTIAKAQIDYFLEGIDTAKSILDGLDSSFNHVSIADFENLGTGKPASSATTKTAEAPAPKIETIKKAKGKGTIFVVDDEAEVCEVLELYLIDLNFSVQTFTTAKAALEALTEDTPDIILSDIAMPEMDGISFVKKVREMKLFIPFIMITGNLTKERILELLKFDVSGFIEKPFQESVIKDVVEKAFNIAQLNAILNRSINYIMYQFSDLDNFLKETGKENVRLALKEELKGILKIQNEIIEQKKIK